MIRITFTPAEVDFLTHRLAVPYAIADVLAGTDGGEGPLLNGASHETIEERADQERLRIGLYAFTDVDPADTLSSAIFLDCIEGSTWLADAGAYLTPAALRVARDVTECAARKLAEAFKWPVVPKCPE